MDLHFNTNAKFTGWAVQSGALKEPFVVVDVGVQGGENPRWHLLGDHLVVYGFDAIEEVVVELKRNNTPNRHYHWLAIGNADGEREFYFNQNDPCSSSFWPPSPDRYGTQRRDVSRTVIMQRLDTLLLEGMIQGPDFLKVDVEGFEKEVLLGGHKILRSVLGIEIETHFGISPLYPKTHFGTIQEILLEHCFLAFDLNFNRIPRARFQRALEQKGLPRILDQQSAGRPATLNVLFSRDLIDETDNPRNFPVTCEPFNVDQIIKAMMIYELHGLNDIAVDMAARFADCLGTRLDIEKAIDLLSDPYCHTPGGVLQPSIYEVIAATRAEIAAIRTEAAAETARIRTEAAATITTETARIRREYVQSTSWRITAPLRALRKVL